jgi:PBP1b-binding outer membrane lipoprotein LpoB
MRTVLIIGFAAVAFLAGCSKKDAAAEAEATPETTETTAAAQAPSNPGLQAQLGTVQSDIETKQYDTAVQKLLEAKMLAQSEADKKAYLESLHNATQSLLEKAQTDPQARATYEALGRAAQGR